VPLLPLLLLLLLLPFVSPADNLLAKKSHKQLLHDYDARRAAAVDFMVLVRPGLAVTAGALTDPQVGGAVVDGCDAASDWDAAAAAAVDFMVLVRPGLAVTASALTDPQVREGQLLSLVVTCVILQLLVGMQQPRQQQQLTSWCWCSPGLQ
jgi:hypothetical protein